MATVRAKVMKALIPEVGRIGKVIEETVSLKEEDIRTKVLEIVKETVKKVRIDEADIVVAGGKGLGSYEGFQLIHRLAETLEEPLVRAGMWWKRGGLPTLIK
jgi:electron transfer flavoprotein alpha subunit